jgi:hydroxymethylglutaryl-CoA reductase (NADPH)
MTIPSHVIGMLERVRARFQAEPLSERMLPSDADFTTLRPVRKATTASAEAYWSRLSNTTSEADKAAIADPLTMADPGRYSANIENFIGTVKLPVGIIGPLRINGLNAHGDFHVPMATTEAALVASYGRGALAATRAGGVGTALLYEGVIRTPAFVFDDLLSTGMFVDWVVHEIESLRPAPRPRRSTASSSRWSR